MLININSKLICFNEMKYGTAALIQAKRKDEKEYKKKRIIYDE